MSGEIFFLFIIFLLIVLMFWTIHSSHRAGKRREKKEIDERLTIIHDLFSYRDYVVLTRKIIVFNMCELKVPMGGYPYGTKWDWIEVNYNTGATFMYGKKKSNATQLEAWEYFCFNVL
jgi:hypothetical protein